MTHKPRLHGDSDPVLDTDWLRLHGGNLDSCPDSDHLSHVNCDPDSNPDSGPGTHVNVPIDDKGGYGSANYNLDCNCPKCDHAHAYSAQACCYPEHRVLKR